MKTMDAAALQYWRTIYDKELRTHEKFQKDAHLKTEKWLEAKAKEDPTPQRNALYSAEYGAAARTANLASPRFGRRELVSATNSESRFKDYVRNIWKPAVPFSVLPENPPSRAETQRSEAFPPKPEGADDVDLRSAATSRQSHKSRHSHRSRHTDAASIVSTAVSVTSRRSAAAASQAMVGTQFVGTNASTAPAVAGSSSDVPKISTALISQRLKELEEKLTADAQRRREYKKELHKLRKQLA
eukprot:TRINITY_DN3812_c0_g1_i1.p1 TRINITY_DN3812_c0_g1~~TRINITY_DN3812_c0_g1_i1.p1  ORF type:complete len:243 (+),score=47.40 TRINITY_DN3812_c0_g1_i1:82-810(+)